MSWTVTIRGVEPGCGETTLPDVEAVTVGAAVLELRFADGKIIGIPLHRIASYELIPVPESPPLSLADFDLPTSRKSLVETGWPTPLTSLDVVGTTGGKATVEGLK